jgi:ketosteroid isomerase-like protein
MPQPTPSLAAETNALKEAHSALNQGDIAAFARIFDPQIEWIEFAGLPSASTHRGRDVVLAYLTKMRGAWAEGSCQPKRLIVAGDRIVQIVHVHVRLANETEFREGEVTEVYTFRNGKVTQVRLFADSAEAMEWAGVERP